MFGTRGSRNMKHRLETGHGEISSREPTIIQPSITKDGNKEIQLVRRTRGSVKREKTDYHHLHITLAGKEPRQNGPPSAMQPSTTSGRGSGDADDKRHPASPTSISRSLPLRHRAAGRVTPHTTHHTTRHTPPRLAGGTTVQASRR